MLLISTVFKAGFRDRVEAVQGIDADSAQRARPLVTLTQDQRGGCAGALHLA